MIDSKIEEDSTEEQDKRTLFLFKTSNEIESVIHAGGTYKRDYEDDSFEVNMDNIFSLIGFYDLDSACQEVINDANLLVELVKLVADKVAEDELSRALLIERLNDERF